MLYNEFMKNKISSFALALSIILSAVATTTAGFVHAESGSRSNSGSSSTTTVKTEAENENEDGTSSALMPEDPTGRPKRITEYKKELSEKVTETDKARIAARCEAAQGVIKGKTTSNNAVTTARTKAYSKIVAKLKALSTTLAAKNVDVTTLNQDIASLQTKITAFITANNAYQLALSDLGMLDCKTDPTAFKAALSATRTQQTAVSADAKAVRSYVNDTIKPVLQALKSSTETKN